MFVEVDRVAAVVVKLCLDEIGVAVVWLILLGFVEIGECAVGLVDLRHQVAQSHIEKRAARCSGKQRLHFRHCVFELEVCTDLFDRYGQRFVLQSLD